MATPRDLVKQGRREAARCTEAADLIVFYLEQLGVECVFGVPGGAIEPFYNALARSARRGSVRPVVARHETGAGFMADGYYHETGQLAVVCTTAGPGATNLVTSVASAFEEQVPMLLITAQTPLHTFGRGAVQESSCTGVNTVSLFQSITRYNTFVSHPDQLEHKLAAALMTAWQSPQGPVHLSIPRDVLAAKRQDAFPAFNLKHLLDKPPLTDESAVESFIEDMRERHKSVFVIGNGCAEAMGEILDTARALDAPIVTTPHGKGLVSPYHPLFRGVIGFAGHESATDALLDKKVDRILAVGTSLSEWASGNWNTNTLLNSRLIHVDSVEHNLTRSPMARMHVRGDIRAIFLRLLTELTGPLTARSDAADDPPPLRLVENLIDKTSFTVGQAQECVSKSAPIKPQRLMTDLTRLMPAHTRWFADSGASLVWAIHYLHPYDRRVASRRRSKPGRRSGRRQHSSFLFRASLNFASMTWAIGAAVGAAIGARGTPVVCITGDGSMLMAGQELTTAVQQRVPVIFVVLNDSALGMVKHGQRLGGAESVGWELPKVDFAAVAEAQGAVGYVVDSPLDLQRIDFDDLCAREGPSVLDVRIDPDECPPMGARVEVLNGKG